jgi:hypothetical protein
LVRGKLNKLTVLEKIGFGAGDMAVNVVISSMMLIVTYFYTDVFGLRPSDLALMFIELLRERDRRSVLHGLAACISEQRLARPRQLEQITTTHVHDVRAA